MIHFIDRQIIEQRQTHQTIRVTVTLGQRTSVMLIGIKSAGMQAQVMEDRTDPVRFEIGDEGRAFLQIREQEIEHVRVIGGIIGDVG